MKKTLFYLLGAAILGLLITVVPLITIAQTRSGGNQQNTSPAQSLGQGLKQLDGGDGSKSSQINSQYITVLAISLIIALLAYNLIGRKAPRRYDLLLRVPPT